MRGCAVWTVVASVGALLPGCARSVPPPAPRSLVIATGDPGGVYHVLGAALARLYGERTPGARVEARATGGSFVNCDAVETAQADIGFTQGDAAYSAYTEGTSGIPRAHSSLRAVAALYTNALQIAARRDGPVRGVRDLGGRRVGIGARGSSTEGVAHMVMEAHGVASASVEVHSLGFEEAAAMLADGRLDAAFVMASYPAAALTTAGQAVGIRLLPVEPGAIRRIRESHPFYRPIVIPRGAYRGQDGDVRTLGVDNLLVCRADLDEELVHGLTALLFESLPELAREHGAARAIDPERGPATPIPLHPGAARFYREREVFR